MIAITSADSGRRLPALVIVGIIVAAGSVVLWTASSKTDITFRELLERLNANGLNLEGYESTRDPGRRPTMWFVAGPTADQFKKSFANAVDSEYGETKLMAFGLSYVTVTNMRSAANARDVAGVSLSSFAWERFTFRGSPELIEKIKQALR